MTVQMDRPLDGEHVKRTPMAGCRSRGGLLSRKGRGNNKDEVGRGPPERLKDNGERLAGASTYGMASGFLSSCVRVRLSTPGP